MMMMMMMMMIIIIMFKYETYFTCEITLRVAQTVNTEQLQHYIPSKLGLFQAYNYKHPA